MSLGERGDHRRRAGGLDAQHRSPGGAFGEIGGDARDATAPADRNDHQVRFAVELIEQFDGDGALPGDRAGVVVRGNQGGAGARDVVERGGGGFVVGLPDGDQLDELAAVVADAVALLLRRLGGDVDPAADAHRSACHRETLRVVARRRAHHARGDLVGGELPQQVVGSAQLVRADRLEVFALQVHRRADGFRKPFAELQRGPRDHVGNSLSGRIDVGRGHRRRRAGALAQVSGHRSMVTSRCFPTKTSYFQQRAVGFSSPGSARRPGSADRSSSGTRRSPARPRRRAPTRSPSRRRRPRAPRSRR